MTHCVLGLSSWKQSVKWKCCSAGSPACQVSRVVKLTVSKVLFEKGTCHCSWPLLMLNVWVIFLFFFLSYFKQIQLKDKHMFPLEMDVMYPWHVLSLQWTKVFAVARAQHVYYSTTENCKQQNQQLLCVSSDLWFFMFQTRARNNNMNNYLLTF